MSHACSIIVADDHPLFRSALSGTLMRQIADVEIHEACDLSSLQLQVENNENAQLILLDLHMPGAEGFSGLVFLVAHYPHIPVMIVSAHDQADIIRRAMDHGASGFLPKSSPVDDMAEAIHTVLNGGVWMPNNLSDGNSSNLSEMNFAQALAQLTPQQFRVASMVSQGLLNKQIAYELNVTEATIKAHMTEIFRKLGLNSRTQVVKAMGELSVQPLVNQTDL
ncbi:response regulator transcription factor [Pseudomonas sp. HK3]|jgi:DNA-binding NarL/FixJ family response regulator